MMAALEKDVFFKKLADQGLAVTYSDVRLQPGRSYVPAAGVDITSRFSRNVALKSPFVSSAMDTVTESAMAIAMAKLGGIGVIHSALTIVQQKEEVRRVKLHLNGLIEKPVCFTVERTIESVLNECEDRGFGFRTFPVVDGDDRLVGLVTQNDFDFAENTSKTTLGDVMTPVKEVMSAPQGTTIQKAYDLMMKNKKKTLPIIDKGKKIAGLFVLSDVTRIVRANSGLYNVDPAGRLRVAAAVSTRPDEAIERIKEMRNYLDVVVLDSARGDSIYSFQTLEAVKSEFPDLDVVVGNVSVAASAKDLMDAGADGIKVGQGPGSICTTRIETGIGVPQVTAVYDCVKAVGDKIPIIADGGITNKGDVSIAIAAGASSVMMGSMLAGTKETPGKMFETDDGKLVKGYRGMGSEQAMAKNKSSRIRYSGEDGNKPLPEGIESIVPYKGSVNRTIESLTLALRASMEYVGTDNLEEHRGNKTRFVRNTPAGVREASPHDVKVVSG